MKKFLITNKSYYTNFHHTFAFYLYKALKNNRADFIIIRDKKSKNIKLLALFAKKIAKRFHIKNVFINQHIKLANELNLGIHLTSTQFRHIKNQKQLNKKVIISTHSKKEILKAKRLNANYILYSPIFYVENKGKPKGLKNLDNICKINNNIVALGGIKSNNEVNLIKKFNFYGFASIRYFVKH